MKRKIIQLAGKTLVVSIPHSWAKSHGVKKGDEIDVIDEGRSLSIMTEGKPEIEKAVIELSKPEKLARRKVSVAYKRGYDELELRYEDPSMIKAVQQELENIMGFEIMDSREHSCVVKNIAGALDEEFDTILRRVFLVTLSMGEDCLDAIKQDQKERLADILFSEKTTNKLTDFCKRILNKKGYKEIFKTNLMYAIVWELEKVADDYRDICKSITDSKDEKISEDILSLFSETNKFFRSFYEMFYSYDEEKASKFSNKAKDMKTNSEKCLNLAKTNIEKRLAHYLMGIVWKTHEMAGPFYATVL